jgi:CheY-like chemotaxis protein
MVQLPNNLGILIAEPDNDMQRLYNIYLKNLGIRDDRIIVAESGKKCLEIFENRNKKQKENNDAELQSSAGPMLVILDMNLKDISSVRVVKELMSINPQHP